jgi:hypothetical protein
MKKTMIVAALLAGALSVYSQGQLEFSDYATTSGFGIVIFGPQSFPNSPVQVSFNGYSNLEEQGNPTLAAYPQEGPLAPGTTVYASANPLAGSGYDVQALIAAGANQPLSALSLTGPVETGFYSGGNAGLFLASIGETTGVPAGPATVAIAAWVNNGVNGAATTLGQAQADGYAWGISSLGNVNLTAAPNMPAEFPAAVTSFSLTFIPEPGTIALGVIGASAFLMRLRRPAQDR